jgi:hypothetical protein
MDGPATVRALLDGPMAVNKLQASIDGWAATVG